MKKAIFSLIGVLFFTAICLAGEVVTLPQDLTLTATTTNLGEKISVAFYYNPDGTAYAVITYKILDTQGRVHSTYHIKKEDSIDNPTTDPALCTGPSEPFGCCTGVGTGNCDETSTAFTDFTAGFLGTLKTRAEAAMWTDAQTHYEVAP